MSVNAKLIAGGSVWHASSRSWHAVDVAIEGTRITAIGPGLPRRAQASITDARGKLVIPGLINTHTHGHNNLLKGTGDCRWLEGHINAMSAVSQWTPRDLYLSTMVGIIEMLRSGTTAAYDMVRAPTDEHVAAVAQAYAEAGMRVTIAPSISDMPFVDSVPGLASRIPPEVLSAARSSVMPSADSCLAFAERAVHNWHGVGDGLISIAVGPLIADVCSDELLAGAARLARRLGVGTHMHLLESKYQAINGALRGSGTSWVQHLDELGYLGPECTFAHGVWLTDTEVELLAHAGATVAHNPASNLKLGSGLAPIADYLRAGLNVSLATDGSASGDTLDMFSAMWLAALLTHSRTPQPDSWLSSADVFALATERGAKPLGYNDIGALAVGAYADIVIVNLDDPKMTPLNNPITQLVYCGAGSLVDYVLVQGQVVLDHGCVVGVDESSVLEEARQAAARLATQDGLGPSQLRVQEHLDALQRDIGGVGYAIDRFTAPTSVDQRGANACSS